VHLLSSGVPCSYSLVLGERPNVRPTLQPPILLAGIGEWSALHYLSIQPKVYISTLYAFQAWFSLAYDSYSRTICLVAKGRFGETIASLHLPTPLLSRSQPLLFRISSHDFSTPPSTCESHPSNLGIGFNKDSSTTREYLSRSFINLICFSSRLYSLCRFLLAVHTASRLLLCLAMVARRLSNSDIFGYNCWIA